MSGWTQGDADSRHNESHVPAPSSLFADRTHPGPATDQRSDCHPARGGISESFSTIRPQCTYSTQLPIAHVTGEFSDHVCASPGPRSDSDESTSSHSGTYTPPASQRPSPGAAANHTVNLSRGQSPDDTPLSRYLRHSNPPAGSKKRRASTEYSTRPNPNVSDQFWMDSVGVGQSDQIEESDQVPALRSIYTNANPDADGQDIGHAAHDGDVKLNHPSPQHCPPSSRPRLKQRIRHNQMRPPRPSGGAKRPAPEFGRDTSFIDRQDPTKQDSGFYSTPSKQATLDSQSDPHVQVDLRSDKTSRKASSLATNRRGSSNGESQASSVLKSSDLPREPFASPITNEQLAAEIKGIYSGLVLVEAKCISVDSNPPAKMTAEDWQTQIALHRTLLYEHNDFLMATQHPASTQSLKALPGKYSMPARMWKHGIHAFLEVLRHRRPDSQEFMLAFIYIAYQMIALLYETVPSFTDTWIECLGDLARYRMAIEADKESHASWGAVAARWYTLASDRHPTTGRLYHHLGILERPSLRKFCSYSKSLTSVVPFSNAQDSLTTLSTPITQDEEAIQSSRHSVEARIVTLFALVCLKKDVTMIERVGADALKLIHRHTPKLRDIGAFFATTCVSALFEFGSASNALWQLYGTAINHSIQTSHPSTSLSSSKHSNHGLPVPTGLPNDHSTCAVPYAAEFCAASFNTILRDYDDEGQLMDVLPFAHVMLAWLHSLHSLRIQLDDCRVPLDSWFHLLMPTGFSSVRLCDFLNCLTQHYWISDRILECARQGCFLTPEWSDEAFPLADDFLIRGLIWGQFYFVPNWFDRQSEDDGRNIEDSATAKARAERVLWLGLFLAFHSDLLHYDTVRQEFLPVGAAQDPASSEMDLSWVVQSEGAESGAVTAEPLRGHRLSISASSSSLSEDGFMLVKSPRITSDPYIAVSSPPLSSVSSSSRIKKASKRAGLKRQRRSNESSPSSNEAMPWSSSSDLTVGNG